MTLIFDYNLPIEATIGETMVIPAVGKQQESVLRKVSMKTEDINEDILEAAILIIENYNIDRCHD